MPLQGPVVVRMEQRRGNPKSSPKEWKSRFCSITYRVPVGPPKQEPY